LHDRCEALVGGAYIEAKEEKMRPSFDFFAGGSNEEIEDGVVDGLGESSCRVYSDSFLLQRWAEGERHFLGLLRMQLIEGIRSPSTAADSKASSEPPTEEC
jgi:hypothetical protein